MSLLCPSPAESLPREWRRLDRHLLRAWRQSRVDELDRLHRGLDARSGLLLDRARISSFEPGFGLSFRLVDDFGVQLGAVDRRAADRLVAALTGGHAVRLLRVGRPGVIWYFEFSGPCGAIPVFAGFAVETASDIGGVAVIPTVAA